MNTRAPRFVLYLAVLPKYRRECIELISAELGDALTICVSPAHLDPSVRTGIPEVLYKEVRMVRFAGRRAFIQLGGWGTALSAETTVVDLNPRSVTSWVIILLRKLARKRTLAWGHLYPQSGADAPTGWARTTLRRLTTGTILYTYGNLSSAIRDMPDKPVWVAPNALYSRRSIGPAGDSGAVRNDVLYVGRFEPAKKVALLIEGFSIFARKFPDARLVLVGDGSQLDALRTARARMDDPNSVLFAGWIDHVSDLSNWYATAFCTVSPGFAGLGLTQSLGFGIPMVIADDEPHSPEIELAVGERTNWFVRDSPESLAMAIEEFWNSRDSIPRSDFSDVVRETYSAEAMADGLLAALRGSTNMRVGT